jgi:hypothetical protein
MASPKVALMLPGMETFRFCSWANALSAPALADSMTCTMYSAFSASVVWARIPDPAEAAVANTKEKIIATANLLPFILFHQ